VTKLKVDYHISHQYEVEFEVPDEIFEMYQMDGEDSILGPYLPLASGVYIGSYDVIG